MALRSLANAAASPDSQNGSAPQPTRFADTATAIGTDALELARRARAIGLTSVAHLLECAALQAGSEAASAQCPTDA
jgi:hypothetical protein